MLTTIIGFASGIISGMGIGGGTILIPALVFILGTRQQIAQSINLLVFIPSAIGAIIIHLKNKNIEKSILIKLIIAGCAGAVAGSYLAVNLDSNLLKRIFGVFLLVMGLYEVFSKAENKPKRTKL
ncbi:MAG: sulfite exporter TauE/SafE family protein [Caulobacteraceae bacterium]